MPLPDYPLQEDNYYSLYPHDWIDSRAFQSYGVSKERELFTAAG